MIYWGPQKLIRIQKEMMLTLYWWLCWMKICPFGEMERASMPNCYWMISLRAMIRSLDRYFERVAVCVEESLGTYPIGDCIYMRARSTG